MRTKNEHRALKNLVHRKREGEYEAMIADSSPISWSAAHPAYAGMNMGSRHREGGETDGQGDTETVHRCLRAGTGGEGSASEDKEKPEEG